MKYAIGGQRESTEPEDEKMELPSALQVQYDMARSRINDMGHRVSAGSWIDEEIGRYYVCSVKTVGEFSHPLIEIMGTERSEYTTI